MRAGYRPDSVGCSTAIKLSMKRVSVNTAVPFRVVPVGHAVLMPRHRCTEAGLLDEHGFIEWDKILSVETCGQLKKIRMCVKT